MPSELAAGSVMTVSSPRFTRPTIPTINRRAAAEYAARSPEAIKGIKRLVNEAWQLSEFEALEMEARLQLGVIGSPNQVEAVTANLEKRPPKFED